LAATEEKGRGRTRSLMRGSPSARNQFCQSAL
jgi:hypothetical protein